jgi:uncharacterized protein (DUF1501 family)
MDRRIFVQSSLSAAALRMLGVGSASVAFAAAPPGASYRNLLVLIELKGGNVRRKFLSCLHAPAMAISP